MLFVYRERLPEMKGKSKCKKLCRLDSCTLAGARIHEVAESAVMSHTKD